MSVDNNFFEWITAPQPTVLKGFPVFPVPTVAFQPQPYKGFPLTNVAASSSAFFVSCFLLDKDTFDPTVFVDEANYDYLNEYVDGRKASVKIEQKTGRLIATFENLRINVSGFHTPDGYSANKWRKVYRREFRTRQLVFQGWVQLAGGTRQCIFQEAYPINVYTHLLQIPAHEISIKYITPNATKEHVEREVYLTGTGFISPTFVFFANDAAQVLSQDYTWLKCVAPPLNAGKARVVVYSGGSPSNVNLTFSYRDPSNPIYDERPHQIITTEADGIFGEEGLGLFNPDIGEWEFPTFVEKFLADFCNPETLNTTHFGANALHIAASFGKTSFLDYYMQDKPDPNTRDKTGATPLYLSAACDRTNAFRFLLEYGADVKKADNDGITCLHQAARHGNIEIMQLCLQNGANPNTISSFGDSALHYAVASGQPEPVQLLLSAGANPNIANKAGETPMHWAALFDFPSLALEIWHFGGQEDLEDIDGDTPIRIRAMQLKPPRRIPQSQVSTLPGVLADLPPNTGTFMCKLCRNTFPFNVAQELKGNMFDRDCYDKLISAQKDRASSGRYNPVGGSSKPVPPTAPPKKR